MIAEVGSPSPRPSPQRGEEEVPSVCRRNSSRGGNSRPKYARVISGDRSLRSPLWSGSPGRPPGRGFFLNSCQIFPSSKGFPKHLPAMKGAVMVPPPHHLFLRWNQKPRSPVRGFSLLWTPPCGVGASRLSSRKLPLSPLGRGRPLCGRVRGRLNSISGRLSPPHPNPLPKGRGKSSRTRLRLSKPGNLGPGHGLFQQRTCFPLTPHHQVAGPDSCVSVLEAPALPRGFFFAPHG